MAKKIKKDIKTDNRVDISKLLNLPRFDTQTVTLADGVEVIVSPFLSIGKALSFIDNVVDSCFNTETGEYMPESKELAIGLNILTMYTNCYVPDDIESEYKLLYATDKCEKIREVIDINQFYDILDVIDASIDHRKQLLVSNASEKTNSLLTALTAVNAELGDKFKEFEDMDMQAIMKGLLSDGVIDEEKLVNAIKNTQEQK